MKRLYTAQNLTEARLLADALGRAGIATRVLNEYAHGALGDIPFLQALPEVWVSEDADLDRARRLLTELRRPPGAGRDRRCPACGESSPASFECCWKCGAALEDR
jgi:hypothetical protein